MIISILVVPLLSFQLCVFGSTAWSQVDKTATLPYEVVDDGWRKTVDGWERKSDWSSRLGNLNLKYDLAAIHPLVVTTLVVLICVGALLFFDQGSTARKLARDG